MTYEQIRFEVEDRVAVLTLDRPEARNALSEVMRREIDDVMRQLHAQAGAGIRALVLTGAGGHFCAGGDVKAQRARAQADAPEEGPAMQARRRLRGDHGRLQELLNLELPVIVAVDGAAAGAGFSLALVGDFILASDRAYFVQSFGRLGLVPDWNSLYLLPRLVGLQRAKEMVFTARRVPAAEAMQMGLVHAVHAPERLLPQAKRLARRLAQASTTAIALSKNLLNQSFHLDNRAALEMEAMAQAIARESSFHREAVSRFADKRPALYDWESLDREDGEGGGGAPEGRP